MMEKIDYCRKAKEYHELGMNCAQSVLLAFRDLTGLDETVCCGIASGFGGGVRCGNICGAISAPVMILGMLYPHNTENGMLGKQRMAKMTKEFQRRFAESFGYLNCSELLKQKDLAPMPMAEELGVSDHCGVLIVSAAELLYDMLEEMKEE